MGKRRRQEDPPGAAQPIAGKKSPSPPFAVVGIGASAGGLEAASQLLRHLPGDLGLALVLVQHLDPNHPSSLVELLSKVSAMPVREAVEGVRLEPGQVYVIPPNRGMVLHDGCLLLTPRKEGQEARRPIDRFLRSVAEECQSQAIGIILSGTGSDGTEGLEAIRAEGGITFAQDATAVYGGMPSSAQAAGCVDFVLPAEAIAGELLRISLHPSMSHLRPAGQEAGTEADASLQGIVGRLSGRSGIDFTNYKQATLKRRIQRRMVVRRIERFPEYEELLAREPGELEALSSDVLISVTRFFRDPEVFEALERTVFPALVKDRRPDRPIRIWVPGCATGEESYSLAISLLEFLGPGTPHQIMLFGTDVSERAIAQARAGRFPKRIASEVDAERLRRFFSQEDDGYVISKQVRDLCVFARHDATRDPPFSKVDLISCRNVLIYLGPVLQKRILPLFHYALQPGGFLVLGTSETIGPVTDLFAVVDPKRRIYSPRPVPSRLPFEGTRQAEELGRHGRATPAAPVSPNDLHREADRVLLARCAPPGVLIDESLEILHFRGNIGLFLTPAAGVPSNNLRRMAREGLFPDLGEAIEQSKAKDGPIVREGLRVRSNGGSLATAVEVFPVRTPLSNQRGFLVLFSVTPEGRVARPEGPSPSDARSEDDRAVQLERELAALDDYLRATVEEREAANEELRALNEELMSSNEELQSTNEELQTAQEELQATNEELLTVNEELQLRNEEATRLGSDLANLLASVEIPIVMVGTDLDIRQFTPSAARLLNLIPSDRGRSILDLRPRIDVPDLEALLQRALTDGALTEREVTDVEGRWYSLWIHPVPERNGQRGGAVISLTDIDALKRSETVLRQARDFAEGIVAAVREPLVVLNPELRVTQANEAFRSTYLDVPAAIGAQGQDEPGGDPWRIPALGAKLRALVEEGAEFENLEVEADLPASGHRIIRASARQVAGGSLGGGARAHPMILLSLEDLTPRRLREAEEALLARRVQEAQRLEALGVLAGGIAHDFNNILTAILGYSDLIERNLAEDSPMMSDARQIGQSARRAAELCRQMLAYSGKGRFVVQPLDLSDMVRDLVPLVEATTSKKTRFRFDLEDDLPAVLADGAQIRQVIMNLLLNASESLNERGGTVTVRDGRVAAESIDFATARLRPEEVQSGEYLFLEVEDEGCGMDAQTLERIFDPFFSVKFIGRGLGLAAVLGIVRGHRGGLQVESEPGKGSTFRIFLPATAKPAPRSAVEQIPLTPWHGSGTVLIVDDEPSVRRLLRTICEEAGLGVVEAEDGAAAVDVFRDRADSIDVVLLDLTMPRMDGAEAYGQLRRIRSDACIVLMSGYDESPARAVIDAPGLAGFLPKPFVPAEVLARLREAIDGS